MEKENHSDLPGDQATEPHREAGVRLSDFKSVRPAFPVRRKKGTPSGKLILFTILGSVIGVVLLMLAVQFGRKLDQLFLLVAWFLPGIVTYELVKSANELPNPSNNSFAVLTMFGISFIVSLAGSVPVIQEFDFSIWGVLVVLLISSGYFSLIYGDRKSLSTTKMHPYCSDCNSFLEFEKYWAFRLEDAAAILAHLNSANYEQIAELDLSDDPDIDVARIYVDGCPDCDEGMLSLHLSHKHYSSFRGLRVYSNKESSSVIDRVFDILG